MTDFEFGPVELYLIGMGEEGFSPRALKSLQELAERGIVRLIDLVTVTKTADGDLSLTEASEDGSFDTTGSDLAALGIASIDDVRELAQALPVGHTAALAAVELTWAKELAAGIAESGAEVLATERVPAPVINAVVEAFAREAVLEEAEMIAEQGMDQ